MPPTGRYQHATSLAVAHLPYAPPHLHVTVTLPPPPAALVAPPRRRQPLPQPRPPSLGPIHSHGHTYRGTVDWAIPRGIGGTSEGGSTGPVTGAATGAGAGAVAVAGYAAWLGPAWRAAARRAAGPRAVRSTAVPARAASATAVPSGAALRRLHARPSDARPSDAGARAVPPGWPSCPAAGNARPPAAAAAVGKSPECGGCAPRPSRRLGRQPVTPTAATGEAMQSANWQRVFLA